MHTSHVKTSFLFGKEKNLSAQKFKNSTQISQFTTEKVYVQNTLLSLQKNDEKYTYEL